MKNFGLGCVVAAAVAVGCTAGTEDLVPRSSPLVGTWDGYVEGYRFPSGSDRIRFAIDSHDEMTGAVTGTVTLGVGAPPPPPTDPEAGFPPGYIGYPGEQPQDVYEGVAFTLMGGELHELRFRAEYAPHEMWAEWCALQTPTPESGTLCLPQWGGNSVQVSATEWSCTMQNPETMEQVPVSCPQWGLCSRVRVCECAAGACTHSTEARVSFDIALDGEVADGTITGAWGTHNVRVERAP